MRNAAFLILGLMVISSAEAFGQEFVVLQELFYDHQPPDSYFEQYGINTDYVVYEDDLGAPSVESMVTAAARKAIGKSYNSMVQMDHEYWANNTSWGISTDSAKTSVRKMCETLRWFKSAAPSLKVGFYGFVPVFDPAAYRNNKDSLSWIANDNLLQPLADSVDYLCPSLYAFFADTLDYVGYSKCMVREARRLANGKPVYAYVSPQYHPSGDHYGKEVTHDYMKKILETIRDAGANGVVIWGGSRGMDSVTHLWDSSSGWWKAVKEFMLSLRKDTASLPATPEIIVPSKGSMYESHSLLSRWNKIAIATQYHIQLSEDITFENPILDDSTITDTLRLVGPLKNDTKYYYRARAKGPVSWGTFGVSADFTVSNTDRAGAPTEQRPPNQFVLDQNYPNPFNPSTTIRFGMPINSHVSLIVYNIAGQIVRNIVNGEQAAGYHEVRFDGTQLSSGVYICRFQSGAFVASRMLILLK